MRHDNVFSAKIFSLVILFLISGKQVYSQLARNTFYVEGATKGAVYSINYDRIFHQGEKMSYSYRVGFSIEKNSLSFPIGINMITGQGSHHAEFGFTIIPYIDKYQTFLSGDNKSDKYIYVIPSAGYRYQPVKGGLFFKAGIAPLILLDPPSDNFWQMDPKLFLYGSIGAGFSF